MIKAAGKTRTRFAPSPTGALHAGTIRTALFAWLVARHQNGQFILRIEDTDRSREVEGSVKNITDSLQYLGLDWDEGPQKGGPYKPYFQSQRLDIYKNWAHKLIEKGRAYADPYTKEELEKFRADAHKQKIPFLFRHRRPPNPSQWDGSQALRFKSEPKKYSWHDEVMGDLSTGPEVVDDFILIKADGFPTYNFAHIIDDHLMAITHLVRSQEFISSMPIFLNLYEALEITPPLLATVPNVLNAQGNKKLSKREGAKQLLEYKAMGILPEALMNTLATTGWNDGSQQEIYSASELIKKFDLSQVQHSGAHFDEQRLLWMNGHYIREMKLDDLFDRSKDYWPEASNNFPADYKKKILALVQQRLKHLSEIPSLTTFFFEEPNGVNIKGLFDKPVDKQLLKVDKSNFNKYLEAVAMQLKDSDFSEADITQRLNKLLNELDTKPGVLFALIRIAITGSRSSPEIFGTLSVLGKTKSLERLKKARALLEK